MPPHASAESRVRALNIRNGTFLATYRLVLLHVLYILPKQPTCTCSAPGVAWIVLGKQLRAARFAKIKYDSVRGLVGHHTGAVGKRRKP